MQHAVIAWVGAVTLVNATPVGAQTTGPVAPPFSGESPSPQRGATVAALDSSVRQKTETDDGLKITGSLRLRYELLEGQYRPALPSRDDAITIQTAIAAEYRTGPWRIGAELIDSRGYLIDAPGAVSTSEVNALELSRAYVAVNLGDVDLTAGRFHLNLGSRRLAARNAFRNTINSFTGLRADWRGQNGDLLTAFYTLPHTRLPKDRAGVIDNQVRWDQESFDLTFWGAHYTRPGLFSNFRLEANILGLNEADGDNGPNRNRQLVTAGARLVRPPAPETLDIDIEAAWQIGTIRTSLAASAPRQDVRAFFLHAEAGYSFAGPSRLRISALLDIASGDDPRDKSFSRFDTLFGARRWEFGPSGIFGALARTNIIAPGIRMEATPAPRWDVMALWRPSWLYDRRDRFSNGGPVDPLGTSGRFAGHMLEVRVGHWLIDKRLRLEAGTALMTSGALLDNAPNASGFGDTRYAYGQMTVTF